jgi:hypothetical protein
MFSDFTASAVITPDGKLELSDQAEFKRAMRHFKRGNVTIRVEVDRGRRSAQANRYYRLVLGEISEHTGHDPDELHEYFKHKFMEPETLTVLGEQVEVFTTVTNVDKFTFYVDRVRRFALDELGIVTPEADSSLRGRKGRAA